MTPSEARTEVANLASALLRFNLAATVNTPTVVASGSMARVTWPASALEPLLFSRLPAGSIIEYRRLVIGGHYIALLNDGAMLQISIDIRNNEVEGHRMCYYPCPLLLSDGFDVLAFDELDLLLLEQLSLHQEALDSGKDPTFVTLRLRSPLRFDYAPNASTPTEPASHIHITNPDARIPVYAPLSVGHFVRFVFRHFYPGAWANPALNPLTRWPLRQMNRSITEEEELGLHMNCRHVFATPAAR
jgi:hypothetical protein